MASHQNSVAQGKTCDHNKLKAVLNPHLQRGETLRFSCFCSLFFLLIYSIFSEGNILNQCMNKWLFNCTYNPPTSHLAVSFGGIDSLAFINRNSEKWNTYATELLHWVIRCILGCVVCFCLFNRTRFRQTRCPTASFLPWSWSAWASGCGSGCWAAARPFPSRSVEKRFHSRVVP